MDSFTVSKAIIFILIRGLLFGGAIVMGQTVGAFTYVLSMKGGGFAPGFIGIVAGASGFSAAMAGREWLTVTLLSKLLPPKPEPPK